MRFRQDVIASGQLGFRAEPPERSGSGRHSSHVTKCGNVLCAMCSWAEPLSVAPTVLVGGLGMRGKACVGGMGGMWPCAHG